MRNATIVLGALSTALAACHAASAAETRHADLLQVGQSTTAADLASVDADGVFQFRSSDGETIAVGPDSLVRWSTPVPRLAPAEVRLIDGSVIRLKAAWAAAASFILEEELAAIIANQFGKTELPRKAVRAAFWRLPPNQRARDKMAEALLEAQSLDPASDLVLLKNSDQIAGRVSSVGRQSEAPSGAGDESLIHLSSALGELDLPIEQVHGIAFSGSTSDAPASGQRPRPKLWVGFRDGSLIAADSLVGEGEQAIVKSDLLGALRVPLMEIAFLQANGERVAYLSAFEAASYRHEPYLDLDWPYKLDQNVLGGAPTVGGRRFLRAIGMHSASRLTFDLDAAYTRFAAAAAIDDAAEEGGSAVFRVFLKTEGAWREVFASSVVRGGDPPQEIAVDLGGATQLALVVDYGDRGDERDYANWLDPRLER